MKIQFMACILIFLAGCATANKMNSVSVGMTKAEVIQAMGSPVSTSATGSTEYLNYHLSETSDNALRRFYTPYFVRLVDGKVDAYGRTGDFDSTQPSTIRIETENID